MLPRRLLLAGPLLRSASSASSIPPTPENVCYWNRLMWSSCYFHGTSDQTSREAGSRAKLAVLAGDFILSRAFSSAASLDNTEVLSLLATAINNLVTGELMQMSITSAQRSSMDYYLQKTYYKTASLISNSCKAITVLAGQTAEVQGIAYQLIDDILDFTGTSASLRKASLSDIRQGIVTAPILFAMEEFPQLREIVELGFDDPSNVDMALKCLSRSQGIKRTRLLAAEHAKQAADAIDALPESNDQVMLSSREALKDLTQKFMRRTK